MTAWKRSSTTSSPRAATQQPEAGGSVPPPGPARLQELIDWGLNIIFSDERAIFTSGLGLMDVLLKRARAVGVDLLEDVMLIDLVVREGMVTGALALDIRKGEFIHVAAKAVVMATGGWHKAFWPNTGMRDLSGEGMVIAHRAGADLGNMEFITCCCNVLLEPPMWRGSLATYIIGMLAGNKLTNNRGEAFLDGYDPYTVSTGTSTEWNNSFVSYATSRRSGKAGASQGRGSFQPRGHSVGELRTLLLGGLPELEVQGPGPDRTRPEVQGERTDRGGTRGRVL